jgi:tetratricopeptide (TPR) repeat protein
VKSSKKKRKIDLIRLLCSCGKRVKVAASFAGKIGRCPQCGKRMPIPALDVIEAKMKELKKKGQNGEEIDFDIPSLPSLKEIVLDNTKQKSDQEGTDESEQDGVAKPPWLAKKGKGDNKKEGPHQPAVEAPADTDSALTPEEVAGEEEEIAEQADDREYDAAAIDEPAPQHATATAAMLHGSPYQAQEMMNDADPQEGEEVAEYQELSEQDQESGHGPAPMPPAEIAIAAEEAEPIAAEALWEEASAQEALPADFASEEIMAKPFEEITELGEDTPEHIAAAPLAMALDTANTPAASQGEGEEDIEICEVFEEAVAVEDGRAQDSALVAVEENPSDVVDALVISEGESFTGDEDNTTPYTEDLIEKAVQHADEKKPASEHDEKEAKDSDERTSDSSILLEVMDQQTIEGGENLLKGKSKLEAESWDEALQYMCACIAQEEDMAAAYYLRAVIYIKKKAWDMALEDLEKAKICGHHEEDVENRINQVRYLRANYYRSIGAYSEALADLDQIISSNVSAEKGKVYWARARYLMRQKAWEVAIEDIEKAIQVHYVKPAVYEAGGKISLNQGDFASAVHYFTAAINKGGKNVYLYHARSEAYFFLKNCDAALADVKVAQQMTPEDPYLYDLEGLILNEKGLAKEADKAFEHSLGLAPEYPAHYFNRGIAYIGRGRYDLAISDFSKVIQLDSKDRIAYLKRAICYQEKKNPNLAQAREDFKKVAELEKNSFYRGHH